MEFNIQCYCLIFSVSKNIWFMRNIEVCTAKNLKLVYGILICYK